MDYQDNQLTFKVHPARGGHEVPVALLTQALNTLQELVHLFALKSEGKTLRRRLRLSDEIKTKYVLCCSPPQSGSFAITGRVLDSENWFASDEAVEVVTNLHGFSRLVQAGNPGQIHDLIPDRALRNRILSRFSTLTPPAGSGHRYELVNGSTPGVFLDDSLPGQIEAWLNPPDERSEVQTVTGRLDAISFGENKLTLLYQPRQRSLECFYTDDLEPMLLEKRRDLIQVTGRVIMDDAGHPRKIEEVDKIQELDLSPMQVSRIQTADFALKAPAPLQLKPELSDDEQFLLVAQPEIGLDAFATTRTALFNEVQEQILMLWQEYAREADGNLSPPALACKRKLTELFVETPHAEG